MATGEGLLLRINGDSDPAIRELDRLDRSIAKTQRLIAAESAKMASDSEAAAQRQSQAYGMIGVALLAVAVATAAVAVKAVTSWATYDQQISHVESSSVDAAAHIEALGDAAIEAGAKTVFSATEAAQAEENLAKAGLSAADILGGALAGSLDLAAAGSFAVAEAASITAGALTQFNLEGGEAVHVADLLASGATKAQGDVRDLGLALQYVGTPLAALDVSIEDTTGVLALFADHMIIGERAGTTLRSMIASLTAPSQIAKAKMAELGISVFDAAGKFVGLDGVAGELNRTLADATDAERALALGVIFGNEALQGANVLVDAGAQGVRDWTAAVDDGTTAASIAATRLDNLAGDYEKLRGAIDSALIQTGSEGNEILRATVQAVTAVVDVYNEMGDGVKQVALATTAIVTAVTLAGAAYFLAAPKVLAFKNAVMVTAATETAAATYTKFGTAAMAVGKALPIVGGLLAVGTIALGYYAKKQAEAVAQAEAFAATLDTETGALTEATRALALKSLAESGALGSARMLGVSIETLVSAYLGMPSALALVNEAIERGEAASGGFAGGLDVMSIAARTVSDAMGEGADTLATYAAMNDTAGEAARRAAVLTRLNTPDIIGVGEAWEGTGVAAEESSEAQVDASEEAADALQIQEDAVRGVLDASRELAGLTMSVAEANSAYQQSLDDLDGVIADIIEEFGSLDEALLANGAGFDDTTQAGRDLQKATFGVAESQADAAQAAWDLADATGGDMVKATADLVTSLGTTRDALYNTLVSMGIEETAARTLADSIVDIPDASETELLIEDAEAKRLVAEQEERLRILALARTTRLLADPSGAIEGVGIAQGALNTLHDKTVTVWVQPIWDESRYGGPAEGLGGDWDDYDWGRQAGSQGAGSQGFGSQGFGMGGQSAQERGSAVGTYSIPAGFGAGGGYAGRGAGATGNTTNLSLTHIENNPFRHESAFDVSGMARQVGRLGIDGIAEGRIVEAVR